MPSLLSRLQLASLLSVDVRTVDRWCKQGKLNPIRIGHGVTRFRSVDLERFLSENQTVTA
jgi:excisionase family DNA binding protein